MATWQFTFSVIPEKTAKNNNNQHALKLNDFDDSISWNGYCLSESSIEKIAETLKQTKSWSDSIRQFGCADETCVELFYDKNTLLEISIRLDLRSLTSEILKMVIDFVKDNKALILTPQGVLLKPVLEDVIVVIKKSGAYSFVKNPQEFLSSLNR